jgi:anti-sigma factor RsiW
LLRPPLLAPFFCLALGLDLVGLDRGRALVPPVLDFGRALLAPPTPRSPTDVGAAEVRRELEEAASAPAPLSLARCFPSKLPASAVSVGSIADSGGAAKATDLPPDLGLLLDLRLLLFV